MNFIENVKSGVSAAVGSISDAAQNLIEKNRVNAKINRLKLVIKNESSVLNKAYAQLGKYYFENADAPQKEEVENLFEIVSNSKARLKMAQDLYLSTVQQKQTEESAAESDAPAEPFVDTITVACSNEDEYKNDTAEAEEDDEKTEELVEEIIEKTEDIAEKAEDVTEEFVEKIQESAEEMGSKTVEAADDENEIF